MRHRAGFQNIARGMRPFFIYLVLPGVDRLAFKSQMNEQRSDAKSHQSTITSNFKSPYLYTSQ